MERVREAELRRGAGLRPHCLGGGTGWKPQAEVPGVLPPLPRKAPTALPGGPRVPAPSTEASPGEQCARSMDEGLHPNPSLRFSLFPEKKQKTPFWERGCK